MCCCAARFWPSEDHQQYRPDCVVPRGRNLSDVATEDNCMVARVQVYGLYLKRYSPGHDRGQQKIPQLGLGGSHQVSLLLPVGVVADVIAGDTVHTPMPLLRYTETLS